MLYIIDTYAWIEYFRGSHEGEILNKLFNGSNKFITMECCLAELNGYCIRNKIDFDKMYEIVKANSIVLPVLTKHWINAAVVRHKMRKKMPDFGMIDSILVAKQEELKCKVISGDSHFKKLKDVIYMA